MYVVDTGVPGRVAARAGFEFGSQREHEREVDLGRPLELVRLLCGVVGRGQAGVTAG